MYIDDADKIITPYYQYAYSLPHDDVIIKLSNLTIFAYLHNIINVGIINHTPTAKRLVCGRVRPRSDSSIK